MGGEARVAHFFPIMCMIGIMCHMSDRSTNGAGIEGTLIVLCGGMSEEHEVSLASARSVLAALPNRSVRPLVIERNGHLLDDATSRARLGLPAEHRSAAAATACAPTGHERATAAAGVAALDLGPGDVVFPLLHGPYGEDGCVQGLLRLMAAPYVGSSVLASAVGMDKLTMKAVFAARGLPQVDYQGLAWHAYDADPAAALAAARALGFPLFVKPANLGSSLGIARASDEVDLCSALAEAFRFDRRVIVEAAVVGVRELEVAVLGNEDPALSPVGEIRYRGEFYDYASKYQPGGAELMIPAPVSAAVAERATELARSAFEAIDGAGLARVDLFYDEANDTVYVNEINTMPGFTATSMYPRLWAAAGLPFDMLVERLVELARERA